MATSSILGGDRAALQPSGRGADLLGPSDSSDTGSDAIGELGPDQLASDTDRFGTGERASADLRDSGSGLDILPDHVDRASRGGAADTDDELDELAASDDDDSDAEDAAEGNPS
ncbi:MAG: hypothetical protein JWQ13_126 [Ramlibacter sp.]|nr:hypothetical protein [Ramlibacter sp.]